jgi:hypothetical protein
MRVNLPAIFVLLVTSPIDFPLMLIGGELWPHKPDLSQISNGSWYHKAKGFWAQSFRDDGEYWSKLARFIIWWQATIIIGMAT